MIFNSLYLTFVFKVILGKHRLSTAEIVFIAFGNDIIIEKLFILEPIANENEKKAKSSESNSHALFIDS